MTALTKISNTEMTAIEYFGDSIIEQFIASRNASENTAKTYRNALRQLVKFFAANGITQPSEADINAFVATLKAQKKSAATLRLYTTVTKTFFTFTARKVVYPNIAADVVLKLRKTTTHAKKSLTAEQAKSLLQAVKGEGLQARRDRAIIALALVCGLRTCEISRADVGDLREDGYGGYFLDVQGKGRIQKDAVVRVPAPVAKLLDEYLNLRGEVDSDAALFVSESNQNRGERLSVQSVGKMIKRQMKIVGIDDKRISAHSCRHFAATTAIRAGVDVREVQAMLRHTSLNVTAIYLHDMAVETRRAELSVAESLFGGAA